MTLFDIETHCHWSRDHLGLGWLVGYVGITPAKFEQAGSAGDQLTMYVLYMSNNCAPVYLVTQ